MSSQAPQVSDFKAIGELVGEGLGEYLIFRNALYIGLSALSGEYGEYILKFQKKIKEKQKKKEERATYR